MDLAWRVLVWALCGASGMAHAWQAGDWVLRAGAVRIEPHESGGAITLGAAGRVPGSALHFDDDTQPMLAVSWMVTDSVGIELLAANPTRHRLGATGITPQTLELGSVRPLAPTLVALWFPLAGQGRGSRSSASVRGTCASSGSTSTPVRVPRWEPPICGCVRRPVWRCVRVSTGRSASAGRCTRD